MREEKKYILILFLICFIAGLLLSFVYAITYEQINKRVKKELNITVKQFFPQTEITEELKSNEIIYYRVFDKEKNLLGYVFICETKGYTSTIKAIVGVEPSGKIKEIKILEQNETPGIGTRITEREFLNSFIGKTKKDKIDTISGATISSQSIIKAVKESLKEIFSD